jgi:hypothetical protein
MFDVIYKGERYRVLDMNDRCYFARDAKGKLVWLNKSECEVV